MIHTNFIYLALLLAVIGNVAYIRDTLEGKTKPNRVTFILWATVPLIAFAAQKTSGGGPQALFTLTLALICFVILAASFVNKKAYWALTKFDVYCGILSVLAVVLWLVSGVGLVALLLSMAADFLAALPTLIKSYKHPDTETTFAYAMEAIAAAIILLTVSDWRFITYGYAAYVFIMCLAFVSLLMWPHKQPKVV